MLQEKYCCFQYRKLRRSNFQCSPMSLSKPILPFMTWPWQTSTMHCWGILPVSYLQSFRFVPPTLLLSFCPINDDLPRTKLYMNISRNPMISSNMPFSFQRIFTIVGLVSQKCSQVPRIHLRFLLRGIIFAIASLRFVWVQKYNDIRSFKPRTQEV